MALTQLILAAKARTTEVADLVDAQISALTLNREARLRVSIASRLFDPVVGNLAIVGDQVAADVTSAAMLIFHLKNTGTAAMTANAFVFEGSVDSTNGIDGTWYQTNVGRTNANNVENNSSNNSLAAGAAQAYAWQVNVSAYKWFRVRCTTAVTASSIATFTLIRSGYSNSTVPNIPSHEVSQVTGNGYAYVSAATTNAILLKGSGGSINEITIFNPSASTIFLKLYNTATVPTPGGGTPITTIPVAAGAFASYNFGLLGKRFITGIGFTIVGAAAATDTTAIAAGVQVGITYQ